MTYYPAKRILTLIGIMSALIFAGDLMVPLGMAGGVLYVSAVLLTLWVRGERHTLYVALAASILTVAGFLLSPSGGNVWVVVGNRVLSLFAIWVTAILLIRYRRMHNALEESEAVARAIIATTVDGIITIDQRGRVREFNAAAERIFGYLAAEVIGRNVSMLMPSPYREAHDEYLRAYLDTGLGKIMGIGREVVGQRRDGSMFPLEMSVSEIPHDGGSLFTGIVRDITERRRLEQEVLRINEQVRHQVGEDLSEGLGQMLTGIELIHRSVSRRLEREEHPAAEESARITELIREADRFARNLTEDLLPVALDAQGLSLALDRLARRNGELFGIECTFAAEPDTQISDNTVATHLYQIAQEAIGSAVKHGRARKVHINLKDQAGCVALSVHHDGNVQIEDANGGWGMSLRLMDFRAHLIGGELVADASDGLAAVICTLPRNGRMAEAREVKVQPLAASPAAY